MLDDQAFVGQLLTLYLAGDRRASLDSPGAQLVRVIAQVYTAIARADYPQAVSFMTDDFEMEIIGPPDIPLSGSWRGRDAAESAIRQNFLQLEAQRPEILSVAAYSDSVLIMGRETGRVKSTGRDYLVHWVQWFTFRDGMICRFLETFDSQTLSQAFR